MPLTAITIENFKGIGEPVTIPLRPITLLFGANSAGKSTVIQALQYAWEVLENRNPDVDRTRLGGEAIDLGGFRNLVHQHDLERSIRITLEYSGPLRNLNYLPPEVFYSESEQRVMVYEEMPNIHYCLDIDSLAVKIVTKWDPVKSHAYVSMYKVELNHRVFARIDAIGDGRARFMVNAIHPMFSEKNCSEYSEYFRDVMIGIQNEYAIPEDMASLLYEEYCNEQNIAYEDGPPDNVNAPNFLQDVIPEWGRLLSIQNKSGSSRDIYRQAEEVSVLSQLIAGAGESVLEALRGLRYLGPLREVPNRLMSTPLHPERERWANGMGAWDALLRDKVSDGENPTLVERCSDYLHETLGLEYTIRREDRIQLPAQSEVFSKLRLFASRFEDMEEDELRRIVSEIEALERVPVVQLHDEKNNIDVSPMDIGVGVSQTLPVVVGAVEPNCMIFAVEQPELHIHPAVQVNLADVFLREALSEDKKARVFLLETHSEHLVLRIMRRMRETCEGRLPAGFPPVTPDQVAVLYVEVVDGRTCVREMPLNERGELVKAWPGGFFEEGLRETL